MLLSVLPAAPEDALARAAATIQARLSDLQQVSERCLEEIEELTSAEGGSANLAGIRGSVDTISTYPVLTQETGTAGTPSYRTTGAPSTAPLGQVVEGALRDVLGWRPKVSDPKGFIAALTQSYASKEVEGRTVYSYTPRTYAVQVQADMGAITGAQASIYGRAKAALDQSLLILERLYALDPAADPQEVEASRAIIRSELTELVNELGIEGGPRVQRVESLFNHLRGVNNPSFDPEQVQGQLGRMRDVFGMTRTRVNTIGEEQNLTDFLTLVDYVNSLKQSWDTQRPSFDRRNTVKPPFLGTQLVLVSRTLAVVAESVQEVYFAFDSVFLGATERQAIELTFADPNTPPIFVAELLAWVDRFASEEGPRLIQDAGKAGVKAFFPTIDQLVTLMHNAQVPPQDRSQLPEGYSTHRVQRALKELEKYLREIAELAGGFLKDDPAPAVLAPEVRQAVEVLTRLIRDTDGLGRRLPSGAGR
jgi:hypothetical protein